MGGLRKFLIYLALFTVIAYLLAFIFLWIAPQNMHTRVLLLIPAFYFVVLLVSRVMLHAAVKKDDRKFSQVYLAISVFRFLLYLAVLIAYSFIFESDAVRFIISFFAFYFFFTVIEVNYMYRDLHPRKI